MNDFQTPYREPAERAPMDSVAPGWLAKNGDVVEGPYPVNVLMQSYKQGRLKATTLVRRQDDAVWRRLPEIYRRWSAGRDLVGEETLPAAQESVAGLPSGSLGLGLAAGFLGGCVGVGLVYAFGGGAQTKRGAWIAFYVCVALTGMIQLARAAAG